MTQRQVRITAVRKEAVDVERLVAGLLLLLQEITADSKTDDTPDTGERTQ